LNAAHIKTQGVLPYADTFAAAVAIREGGIAIIGDPEIEIVEDVLEIE